MLQKFSVIEQNRFCMNSHNSSEKIKCYHVRPARSVSSKWMKLPFGVIVCIALFFSEKKEMMEYQIQKSLVCWGLKNKRVKLVSLIQLLSYFTFMK